MAQKSTKERAREDKRQGKAPTTQAGEFVREEFRHIRKGKHGAASTKQAIAIGLSKARRAGVPLSPPKPGKQPKSVREKAIQDIRAARTRGGRAKYPKRSEVRKRVLKREGRSAAAPQNIAAQTRSAARRRGRPSLHRSALKAVRTKGHFGLQRAARKAARTRARRRASR